MTMGRAHEGRHGDRDGRWRRQLLCAYIFVTTAEKTAAPATQAGAAVVIVDSKLRTSTSTSWQSAVRWCCLECPICFFFGCRMDVEHIGLSVPALLL